MNRIFVFALAAVILTAGAIGGYLYYSGLNVASPTPSPMVTPTPSITPSLSPSFLPSPSPSFPPTPSPTFSPTPKPSDSPTPFPTLSPTLSPSPTPSPVPTPTQTPYYTIHVVNSTLYLDSAGNAHVFGEVENNGTDPLELVRVSTKLYNASDVIVAASFVYIDLEIILPGERSPFEILILDPKDAVYHDVKISSYYVTFNDPYRDFEILSEISSVDDDGYLHVTGEVRNNGTRTVESARVSATFYDSSDAVVATASAYTQEDIIEEGQTGTFEILLTYDDLVSIVDNYSLVVQGNPS